MHTEYFFIHLHNKRTHQNNIGKYHDYVHVHIYIMCVCLVKLLFFLQLATEPPNISPVGTYICAYMCVFFLLAYIKLNLLLLKIFHIFPHHIWMVIRKSCCSKGKYYETKKTKNIGVIFAIFFKKLFSLIQQWFSYQLFLWAIHTLFVHDCMVAKM